METGLKFVVLLFCVPLDGDAACDAARCVCCVAALFGTSCVAVQLHSWVPVCAHRGTREVRRRDAQLGGVVK